MLKFNINSAFNKLLICFRQCGCKEEHVWRSFISDSSWNMYQTQDDNWWFASISWFIRRSLLNQTEEVQLALDPFYCILCWLHVACK